MLRETVFSKTHRLISFVFIVYGFAGLMVQLVALRELSLLFYGNELFIGFSLGAWLLWVGAGSALGQKMGARLFPTLFLAFGPLILLEIILIRLSKLMFSFGATVGPFAMMFTTLALLFPISIAIGALFSTGTAFAKERCELNPSSVYLLESMGAVLCGIAYPLVFAGRFSLYGTAFFASGLTLVTSFFLCLSLKKTRLLFFLFLSAVLILSLGTLGHVTRNLQWKPYRLLAAHDSRYGTLLVTETDYLKQLFENGRLTDDFPDPRLHEEITHWPLLAHPNPSTVLLIGNGATGALSEILKHPVRAVDYLEMDASLLRLLSPFLAPEDRAALLDRRVDTIHEDGRAFLKRTVKKYDVVIANAAEPSNGQTNRFFTREFFRDVKEHLNPDGLFALAVPSSENYLPPQVAFLDQSIVRTLKSAFDKISIIPGGSLILLAHEQPVDLRLETLRNRYYTRSLVNSLLVPSYFRTKLDPERIRSLENQLEKNVTAPLNLDFHPVSYFLSLRTWLFKFQNPAQFLWIFASLAALLWGVKKLINRLAFFRDKPELITLFLLGFSGMGYEILILLAFQAVHGYLYWHMGFLFASFMAGLAAGSWLGHRMIKILPISQRTMNAALLFSQAACGAFFAWIFAGHGTIASAASTPLFFHLLIFPVGLLLGFGFAVFVKPITAGSLYAADLWGSSLGAILSGFLIVPLFGFAAALWIFAASLALAAAALLALH